MKKYDVFNVMKHRYSSGMICPICEGSVVEDYDSSVLYHMVSRNTDQKKKFFFSFEISQMKLGCFDNGSTMIATLRWTVLTCFFFFSWLSKIT